jgi:hypothetical protein
MRKGRGHQVEVAALILGIVTLVVALVTLVVIGYDVHSRSRPRFEIKIRKAPEPDHHNEEISITNRGGPTRLEEIQICAVGREDVLKKKIWVGNELIETHGHFETSFHMGRFREQQGIHSYLVEIKHYGNVVEKRIVRDIP